MAFKPNTNERAFILVTDMGDSEHVVQTLNIDGLQHQVAENSLAGNSDKIMYVDGRGNVLPVSRNFSYGTTRLEVTPLGGVSLRRTYVGEITV